MHRQATNQPWSYRSRSLSSAVHAEQQDPHAVDLREGGVQALLDGAGGGAVGVGGLVPQREQRVEVGDSGDGGAARDAAEE